MGTLIFAINFLTVAPPFPFLGAVFVQHMPEVLTFPYGDVIYLIYLVIFIIYAPAFIVKEIAPAISRMIMHFFRLIEKLFK